MKSKGKLTAVFTASLLALSMAACTDEDKTPKPTPAPSISLKATPPPVLPDGSTASNATSDKPDELATNGVEAPKGRPEIAIGKNSTAGFRTISSKVGPYYHYTVGSEAVTADGVFADATIHKPWLNTADYHSLFEVAAQSSDGNQIVEVGWTVDRVVNGDDNPRLFVFHWVNGSGTCYNACGFVNYGGSTLRPGMQLPTGTTKKFGIQHFDNKWWISYDNGWVGYYPDSLWTSASTPVTFNQVGYTQVFGELAANTDPTCSDMGSGVQGSVANSTAARISNVRYVNGPSPDLYIRSTSSLFSVSQISKRSFYWGGPGSGNVVGGC